MQTVTDFVILGSKITTDHDYSYEFKRSLLLGRKTMTNLGHIFKSRDITLPTEVHLIKAMVFLVKAWETKFQPLGQEDPLEKEMATHSSILVWKIPWVEEPLRLQSMQLQRVGHN